MSGVVLVMDRHLLEAFIDSLTDRIADKVANRLSLRPPVKAIDRTLVAAPSEAAPQMISPAAEISKDPDECLDTKQVAKLLNVSEGTLENWRCAGKGPKYEKFGKSVRYRRSDLKPDSAAKKK